MAGIAPRLSPEVHNRNWAPPLLQLHNSPPVQTKLEIGKPGDKYEKEADSMADNVMMAPYDRSNMVMMAPSPNNPTLRMKPVPKKDMVMMSGNPDNPTLSMKPEIQRNEMMGYEGQDEEKVQMMEDGQEEEMIQPEMHEEEEAVQMKCEDCGEGEMVQRETHEEEGEGMIQAKCADCEEKLQQKPAIQKSEDGKTHASSDLANKLSGRKGQGQPLSNDIQMEMGTKMGADFSNVNVHTDTAAIQMSQEIGAKAFTHGNDIYFNKSQYDPNNSSGKHLLAHELTHTMQQGGSKQLSAIQPQIQRQGDSTNIARLIELLQDGDAEAAIRQFGRLTSGEGRLVIVNSGMKSLARSAFGDEEMFRAMENINGASLYGRLTWMFYEGTDWTSMKAMIGQNPSGAPYVRGSTTMKESFGSELGNDEMYEAVKLLDGTLYQKLTWMLYEGTSEENITEVILASPASELSVVLSDSDMKTELDDFLNYEKDIEIDDVPVEHDIDLTQQLLERRSVCGPRIDSQLSAVQSTMAGDFAGWDNDEKDDRCSSLVSIWTGEEAWDIVQLYNRHHRWILGYRPACGTARFNTSTSASDDLCGNTVEVDGKCFYAGSPNYVIFGKMMKLCYDHYESGADSDRSSKSSSHTLWEALRLVNLYKGRSLVTLFSASANFEASLAFTVAGFAGSTATPASDRPGCFPSCPIPRSGALTYRWNKYSDG